MACALGVERLDELGERLARLLDLKMPGTFAEKLKKLGSLIDIAKAGPRRVSTAPCQEVVETARPSLADIPALRCWPDDGGRYITLPGVFTRDPRTGARNVGMYRLQVFDDQTLGMHWQTHKGGAEHQRVAGEARARASAPHAGGHRSRRRSGHDLRGLGAAPAGSGRGGLRRAGCAAVVSSWSPAARSTSRCRPRRRSCWRATSIRASDGSRVPSATTPATTRWPATTRCSTSRRSPAARVRSTRPPWWGVRPQEDYWLGKATERLFLPIIKLMLPEVVDMNMPAEGVFHNLVIVAIRKRYPGHARKVMSALWGMGLMMLAKTIVVVSDHVNVHDLSEVAWRATGNIDPRRDLVLIDGPMDDLDHAALRHRFGGKLGIDATEKGPLDDIGQPWPDEIRMTEEIRALVTRRWKDYGL